MGFSEISCHCTKLVIIPLLFSEPISGSEKIRYMEYQKNNPRDILELLLTRVTGLEPAIYGVTGRRDNQLRYTLRKSTLGSYTINEVLVNWLFWLPCTFFLLYTACKESTMQEAIMLFFLNIANPFLDTFANIASIVGEQTFVIAVIIYIYWNHDKKKGFTLFSSILFAVLSMGILKAVVRSPRPFQVLESIDGKRLETATGYSFPSGHTTTGAAFYTSLALAFRKRNFSIFCAIMMTLVGLSRLYLGVHWPIDVFAGLLLGILISFFAKQKLDSLYDQGEKRNRFALVFGLIMFVSGLVMSILLNTHSIDAVAFTDLMKILALGAGGYLGFVFEEKKVDFSPQASRKLQIGRYLVGLIGVLVIMGAKVIIPESIDAIGGFVRYTLVGLWATGLFPFIGRSLRLFSGSR